MTQEKINRVFETPLGEQLTSVFVTSDDRVFIRWSEANDYVHGRLEESQPLADKTITEWFNDLDELEYKEWKKDHPEISNI